MTAEVRLHQLYGPDTRTMVLPGHPIREIRRFARTQDIDIVFMGVQAHAIEEEFGERLVHDAPCAVLSLVYPRGWQSSRRPRNSRGEYHHDAPRQ